MKKIINKIKIIILIIVLFLVWTVKSESDNAKKAREYMKNIQIEEDTFGDNEISKFISDFVFVINPNNYKDAIDLLNNKEEMEKIKNTATKDLDPEGKEKMSHLIDFLAGYVQGNIDYDSEGFTIFMESIEKAGLETLKPLDGASFEDIEKK